MNRIGVTAMVAIWSLHPGMAAAAGGSKADLFVSSFTDGTVTAFNKTGGQISQISGPFLHNPVGLAIDDQGGLYIANEEQSNILIYKKPFSGSPVVLSDPGYYPTGVAQYDDGKWVAASNVTSTSDTQGNLVLFKNKQLVKTISNSSFYYPEYCAFDAQGDLFVAGMDKKGKTVIGEIAKAAGKGNTLVALSIGNVIEAPGGIQVTNDGRIVVLDQGASALHTYAKPRNGALGSPISTTGIKGVSLPMAFAFTASNRHVWVTDWNNANVLEFSYPAGGAATEIVGGTGDNPGGVAVNPAKHAD